MKKTSLFLMMFLALTACKELSKRSTQEAAGGEVISGEFLFWNNAAVLKTDTDIYGVVIDEKMYELDNKCKPFKKDEYDMLPVTIKGVIRKNPVSDSWAEVIEVKAVISVSKSQESN